jgi:glycosyltransferase involved in cell wall biosynthesis
LAAVVRHVDPDIVHAHFGPAGALIGPVARADDIPLVVSFHGFDAFKLPSEPFWSEKYTTLFEQAKCITVVSDVMAEHLAEIGAPSDKVTVVRVGKRVDEYPYHAPTSHVRNWISVGRLIEKKGFGDCIRAFQRLVADYPASTLDIIGAGPRYDSLQKEIESAGLTEHVRLLGNRPHSEVKQQMASADGFVLCSKEAGDGNREGVPTVLMEAQAVGLPVVSTTHSGIPEVIPESNRDYLASEGEIEEISDCLNRMAEQSVEELQITSERGRQKIEQDFNLFNEVGGLRHTYQTLNSRKQ